MQDALSFMQAAPSPIKVTQAPAITDTSSTTQGSSGSFEESFFSLILEKVQQESSTDSLSQGLSKAPLLSVEEAPKNEGESKSIDEHLLEDLLSVVNALQQNSQTTTFPTLKASSNLEKILGSETARQDFANVKNVSDLLDLSKKYNLGLEKLSISKENVESLKTTFPALTQNNFFDDLTSALNSAQTTTTPSETTQTTASTQMSLMALLDKQQPKTEPIQASPTLSLLNELFAKEADKTAPIQSPVIQNQSKPLQTKDPITVNQLMVNEQQQTKAVETVSSNIEQTSQSLKEETIAPSTPQKSVETTLQKALNTPVPTAEVKTDSKKPIVQQVVHEEVTNALEEKPVHVKSDANVLKATESIETELTKKSENSDTKIDLDSELIKKHTNNSQEESTTEVKDDSQVTIQDVKTDTTIKTSKQDATTNKAATPKESLYQFASDLKEQVESYRPPIMKVELSLSPKSLGDVDVTLLTRGNNLHVNISSNTNTMGLFTQHQEEVKSALVNMGFTNLEMNFSDQRQSGQSQQNNQNKNSNYFGNLPSSEGEEEMTSLEIVIPQYV